jgi:ABC-2 type transport system permease protein
VSLGAGKIAVVAAAELGMLVRTKAFLITVLLMPVLVAGSIVVQQIVAKQVDNTPRRFAVVDRTGALFAPLAQAAALRNKVIASGLVKGAPFEPIEVEPAAGPPDEQRLELSEQVRRGAIFAFAEIPADALVEGGSDRLRYFSDRPTFEDLRQWLEAALNELIRDARLRGAGVDPGLVARLARHVASEHLGLYTRAAGGAIQPAAQVNAVTTYIVPLVVMYILFLTIFMSAPQLMNAVMQEKMSRISEVLLGAVLPFELMMGKLLGSAGMSLVLALVYLGGGVVVAVWSGYGSVITPELIGFFLLFMVLAVLLYGSVFIAVGAACNDLKDAQSLITPVMLVAIVPMFAWQAVIKSPASGFSVGASLVPTATPFLMQLRLALHPAPPWWQVALGVFICAVATVGCVFAAGKIFRVGILAQGKSAGFAQMLRWLRVK